MGLPPHFEQVDDHEYVLEVFVVSKFGKRCRWVAVRDSDGRVVCSYMTPVEKAVAA